MEEAREEEQFHNSTTTNEPSPDDPLYILHKHRHTLTKNPWNSPLVRPLSASIIIVISVSKYIEYVYI